MLGQTRPSLGGQYSLLQEQRYLQTRGLVRPTLAIVRPVLAILLPIFRCLPTVANTGQLEPSSAMFVPNLASTGPKLVQIGQILPNLGQTSAPGTAPRRRQDSSWAIVLQLWRSAGSLGVRDLPGRVASCFLSTLGNLSSLSAIPGLSRAAAITRLGRVVALRSGHA